MIELTYRELDDYKYQVKKPFTIQTGITGGSALTDFISLQGYGLLMIRPYYAWNGSNWSSDEKAMFASLVHDALYQLMRMGLLSRKVFRKNADALYRDMCIAEGMWKPKAQFRYRMLRLFGKGSTYPEKNPRGKTKSITMLWPMEDK